MQLNCSLYIDDIVLSVTKITYLGKHVKKSRTVQLRVFNGKFFWEMAVRKTISVVLMKHHLSQGRPSLASDGKYTKPFPASLLFCEKR